MRVLLVRAESTPDDDGRLLRARGFDVTAEPFIEVTASTDPGASVRARELLSAAVAPHAWLVLTSAAGLRALVALTNATEVRAGLVRAQGAGARFASVGPTSARALVDLGVRDVLVPERAHTASALLDALRSMGPATAVLPRSSIGDSLLPQTLESRGWDVVSRVVYETTTVSTPPQTAPQLRAGAFDALVLRSPSAVRAVARLAGTVPSVTRVVAGGPTTALTAQRLGITVAAVARDSRPESIADAVRDALPVVTSCRPRLEAHA